MRYLTLCAFVALALGGCETPWEPPAGAEPFEPPETYRGRWAAVEDCSGLTRSFDHVRWWALSMDGLREITGAAEGVIRTGAWQPPHNIYIWDGYQSDPYRESDSHAFTVKHESLHDLIGQSDAEHAHPSWDACGLRASA